MADVFISYDHSDKARAEAIAHGLERAGLTVWWDRWIGGGEVFADKIQAELDRASAVVVLWSQASVRSKWVMDEAAHAAERGRLIPVRIDGAVPPLGFRQYQSLDLRDASDEEAAAALLKPICELCPDIAVDAAGARARRLPAPARLARRLGRFLRRHQRTAATAGLVVAGALLSFLLSNARLEAESARAAEISRRIVAQQENPEPAQIAAVNDAVLSLIKTGGPAGRPIVALLEKGDVAGAAAALENKSEAERGANAPLADQVETLKQIGALVFRSDTQKAIAVYRQANELDPTDPIVLYQLGELHMRINDPEAANAYFVALDALVERRPEDQRDERLAIFAVAAKIGIGRTWLHLGRLEEGEAALKKAEALADRTGARLQQAFALEKLGAAEQERKDLDAAERYVSRARVIYRALGSDYDEARATGVLGTIARAKGEEAAAKDLLLRARDLNARLGQKSSEAIALLDLGSLAADGGDIAGARSFYAEALSISKAQALPNLTGLVHEGLAYVAGLETDAATRCSELQAALAAYSAAPHRDARDIDRIKGLSAECA